MPNCDEDIYEKDYYNLDEIKFVWGVKSGCDLTGCEANLHTMNDIEIIFDNEECVYSLGVETAYMFGGKEKECEYLLYLLEKFTEFMTTNGYSTDHHKSIFFMRFGFDKHESIEDLYFNFKVFVEGYCKVCGIE